MQKIFWRHAQAGWGMNDLSRALTNTGIAQAKRSATWLRENNVDFPVYCSQAQRGQQTASHYRAPKILSALNPGTPYSLVADYLEHNILGDAVIVGHLPWIGEIVGQLLAHSDGYIPLGHSEIIWLYLDVKGQWAIHAQFI